MPTANPQLRLYHGTTADILENVKANGLVPMGKDGFLYATPDRATAELYAYVRSVQRRSLGVIVEFTVESDGWEPDPAFPESFRSRRPVKPENILSIRRIDGSNFERVCMGIKRWLETGEYQIEAENP